MDYRIAKDKIAGIWRRWSRETSPVLLSYPLLFYNPYSYFIMWGICNPLYPSRLTPNPSSRNAAASKILMIKFFMLIPFLKHLNFSLFTLRSSLEKLFPQLLASLVQSALPVFRRFPPPSSGSDILAWLDGSCTRLATDAWISLVL